MNQALYCLEPKNSTVLFFPFKIWGQFSVPLAFIEGMQLGKAREKSFPEHLRNGQVRHSHPSRTASFQALDLEIQDNCRAGNAVQRLPCLARAGPWVWIRATKHRHHQQQEYVGFHAGLLGMWLSCAPDVHFCFAPTVGPHFSPLNFCCLLMPVADFFMAVFSSLFERLPLCFSVVRGSWPISHQVVCAWPWLSLLLMPSVRCSPCFQSCVAALWAFPVAAVGACVWARMCPGQLPPRPAKE